MWPLVFCQHMIHQVIWPSPATLFELIIILVMIEQAREPIHTRTDRPELSIRTKIRTLKFDHLSLFKRLILKER